MVAARAPRAVTSSARAALVRDLGAHVAALIDAGDLDAARVAHEAIGKLLGAAPPTDATGASGAHVVDLAGERRRRER